MVHRGSMGSFESLIIMEILALSQAFKGVDHVILDLMYFDSDVVTARKIVWG